MSTRAQRRRASSASHHSFIPEEAAVSFSWSDMIRALWFFLKGHQVPFIGYLSVTILAVSGLLLPPYVLGKIGQIVISHTRGESVGLLYWYIAGLGVGVMLLGMLRNSARQKLRALCISIGYEARVQGFERLMNFSYAWHQEENSGVRVQRITTGVADLRTLITMLYRKGVDIFVAFVGIFSLFFLANWKVGAFFGAYLFSMVVTERFYNLRLQRLSDQENAASEQTSGTYYESASNALTVKALGIQDGIKHSVIRTEQQSKDRALQTSALNFKKYFTYQIIRGLGLSIFLALIAHQVFAGTLAAPFFLAYYVYYYQMSDAVGNFSDFMTDLADVRAGIGRMMPIFWTDVQEEGTKTIPKSWKKLELSKLGFTYPGVSEPALKNVTMTIFRGQKVGIVGRSGEGKSTLAKLLLSVYAPSHGSLEIGGVPLEEVRAADRVHRISAVLQETELFSLTLRENIEVFRGSDPDRLAMAIGVAQLEEMIAELPKGIETQIGEKGYKLSGGQRQRVGIARAVYAHSDIIIMDEATSSLDSATEMAVQEGIERELKGRTVISIAHRLSTLRHADIIYCIANGMVAESGTFTDLIAKKDGLFRAQYELQSKTPYTSSE
jgi:ABC-type multidrug transport system fused ATPase/permease subunit